MDVKFNMDQGRSLFESLKLNFNQPQKLSSTKLFEGLQGIDSKKNLIPVDSFEKSSEVAPKKSEVEASENNKDPKLNISFQFDLFYELSQKVEAKMGQKGAERFYEASSTVSETFMGNFSLSIDPVGSFMKSTDASLDIDPEVTGEFFDAVEGLADLSPESLENFLKESEDFFTELESVYGQAGGAFDAIQEQMANQAKAFISDVGATREAALSAPEEQFELPDTQSIEGAEIGSGISDAENASDDSNLISMVMDPSVKISSADYKDFLKTFLDYTQKFQQQMMKKFFESSSFGGQISESKADSTAKQAALATPFLDTSA
jgi:hypothetical protein